MADEQKNIVPSEKRERKMVSHTDILTICKTIKKMINKEDFFKDDITFDYTYGNTNQLSGFQLVVSLNKATYCSAVYTSKDGSHLDHVHIIFVASNLGHYTGVFLFNIQLLICSILGFPEVTLENYTDDPVRAAKGIYKSFKVNQRGHLRSDFVGKNLAGKLQASEGNMRLQMTPYVRTKIERDLDKISEKASDSNERNPWKDNYSERMYRVIRHLQQTFTGGSRNKNLRKRSTRNKRYTRKN